MKYIEQINNFTPLDDEEKAEKELILQYINAFDNVLTRDNGICHLTSSAFVVNKTRDKVLCIYHNIYNSWGWTGGHADGDDDLIYIAEKEAKEETGIQTLKLLGDGIVSLDVMPVLRHYRKGKYVPSHIHLSAGMCLKGTSLNKLKFRKLKTAMWLGLLLTSCLQKPLNHT